MRLIALLSCLLLLSACIPSAGPGTSQVESEGNASISSYDLVELTSQIADLLANNSYEDFAGSFGEGTGAPDLRIGVGDIVVVTIFEAASGGLFSGSADALGGASKNISLPPQPVARNGLITVPYAGQIRAAGLTPAQVQANIEAALSNKAIEPQVIVTIAQNASTFVTVAGDIGGPGRVPLGLGGDRLLDVIAVSGGSRAPAYDTFVRVTRNSQPVTVSLARIINDPGQNIYLRPDDQIYVIADPQIFTAFGATSRNATFPFETDRLTLAEAVGRAGGLLDARADPHGVFVFRYERPELYSLISGGHPAPAAEPAGIPVVYQLDMKDPNGFFAAQRFLMRDNDIIYVSNASSVSVRKFLSVIGAGVGMLSSVDGAVNAVEDISGN